MLLLLLRMCARPQSARGVPIGDKIDDDAAP